MTKELQNEKAKSVAATDEVRGHLLDVLIEAARPRVAPSSVADMQALRLYQREMSKAIDPAERLKIQQRIERLTEKLELEAAEETKAEAVSVIKSALLAVLKGAAL